MEYVNTPDAGTDSTTMTLQEASEQLAGVFADSEATPEEHEGEQVDELEAVAEDESEAEELEASEAEGDDVEYEEGEDATEVTEEPADYIEIDGERVNLDEVGKGYLRQSDYTKKTQELAAHKKEMEQLQASIAQEREHLKNVLETVGHQQGDEMSLEELAALAESDPLAYISQKAKIDNANALKQAAFEERQRLQQVEAQQQQAKMAEYVEAQKATLLEAIPELAGENGTAYRADILTYLQGTGFSTEELAQTYDARAIILADKARKWDASQAKGKQTAKKARTTPKVVKPGVATSKKATASKAKKAALSRARSSGKLEDAVQALLA